MSDSEKALAFRANSVGRFSTAYWIFNYSIDSKFWKEVQQNYGSPHGANLKPPAWAYSDLGAVYTGGLVAILTGGVGLGGVLLGAGLSSALTAGGWP